jgi:hypothetical protein
MGRRFFLVPMLQRWNKVSNALRFFSRLDADFGQLSDQYKRNEFLGFRHNIRNFFAKVSVISSPF